MKTKFYNQHYIKCEPNLCLNFVLFHHLPSLDYYESPPAEFNRVRVNSIFFRYLENRYLLIKEFIRYTPPHNIYSGMEFFPPQKG